jgi:predicted nucleic acid-binding protein
MRTAIDSNVFSALWSNEPLAGAAAERLGSATVYAELLAYPKATESFVNSFLEDTGVEVDFELQRSTWIEAGRRFAAYAKRRRRTARQSPKRLLADFIIGSHALAQTDRLMTLDAKRYERDFPELKLMPIP